MPEAKHSSVRARRNKTSTAATLTLVHNVQTPPLPRNREWHPQTLEWWIDTWRSPMAPEFDSSDRHGLFMLAVLVDDFWRKPHWALAAEIRLQRQCFGLSPMDRRRLQWEIDRGEAAADRTTARAARESPTTSPAAVGDPREFLA